MQNEEGAEEPAEEAQQAAGQEDMKEAPKKEPLKEADTLPSETETQGEKPVPGKPRGKKKKIIGLMGIEHGEGPAGSWHG